MLEKYRITQHKIHINKLIKLTGFHNQAIRPIEMDEKITLTVNILSKSILISLVDKKNVSIETNPYAINVVTAAPIMP